MSGLEFLGILGVAASVGQLLDCSLRLVSSVSEVYSRVKDAPEMVLYYTAQISQLVETAREIQQDCELQHKPMVDVHVNATLAEAVKLQRIIDRVLSDYTEGSSQKRVWKKALGSQEKRIISSFERLEKEKTALILSISFSQTGTLRKIHNGVEELKKTISTTVIMENQAGDENKMSEGLQNSGLLNEHPRPKFDDSISKTTDEFAPAETEELTTIVSGEVQTTIDTLALTNVRTTERVAYTSNPRAMTSERSDQTGHTYIGSQSRGKSKHFNGNFDTGTNSSHKYEDGISKDQSTMICGNHKEGGTHIFKNMNSEDESMMCLGNSNASAERMRREIFDADD